MLGYRKIIISKELVNLVVYNLKKRLIALSELGEKCLEIFP
jgi:hypothetical protein